MEHLPFQPFIEYFSLYMKLKGENFLIFETVIQLNEVSSILIYQVDYDHCIYLNTTISNLLRL
jgi:hypothetical protein